MPQLANRRHEIFAIELAAGAPLISAYLTAGYRETYSARFNACRLRNTPRIRERVNELLQEFGERTRINLEWIQETIAPLLEVDPVELYERSDPEDPTRIKLKPLMDMPARVRRAITRIKVDPETGRPFELFLTDKVQVAALLMRSLMGSDGASVSVNVALGARLDAALGRVSPEQQRILARAMDPLAAEGNDVVDVGGTGPEPASRRSTQEVPGVTD